jgi:heme/copper-type cytochrome/quinol oxidase subunit 4
MGYLHNKIQSGVGATLATAFVAMAMGLIVLAGYQIYSGLTQGKELISVFVQSINTAIIALAIFELGSGISKEYIGQEHGHNTYALMRRTIVRFVGTVCIALVLEGLIMVIKYSQLDLAGNLNYPVAILCAASVLLIGMGLFLHLTRPDDETITAAALAESKASTTREPPSPGSGAAALSEFPVKRKSSGVR